MGRKKKKDPQFIDVDPQRIEQMLQRAEQLLLKEDLEIIKALLDKDAYLTKMLQQKSTTLNRLRRLFGIQCSEKTRDVLKNRHPEDKSQPGTTDTPAQSGDTNESGAGTTNPEIHGPTNKTSDGDTHTEPRSGETESPSDDPPKPKVKGHGRIPASDYTQAKHVDVSHDTLNPGCRCPRCLKGHLYKLKEPSRIIRIFGNAPLVAICFDCERLRCNTCGHVFTARPPEQAQGGKYDETAVAMVALLHYGTGMPLNRLEGLQSHLQTPVPASTQWDLLDEHAEVVAPVYEELKRRASQALIFYIDDSTVRILEFMGKRRERLVEKGQLESPHRTGLFTTAIVSEFEDKGIIIVYVSGRRHAGENLDHLLEYRDDDLPPPIVMSDALSRNVPKNHPVIEANCNAHARRHIVDEVDNYPDECRYILEQLAKVYKLEAEIKELDASDELRLMAHRIESGPIMDELKRWMSAKLDEKIIEPNCGLGKAFRYFLKHWDKLTCFLRQRGAPIDNNIVERGLKMAIKRRKASLFYRSERGALVGDIFMTLIYTAELHGVNPYTYLEALLKHPQQVAENPADWLPWTYQETLAQLATSKAA